MEDRFQLLQGVLEYWFPVFKQLLESAWEKSLAEQREIIFRVTDFSSAVARLFRDSLYSGELATDSAKDLWEVARMGTYYDVSESCELCIGWLHLFWQSTTWMTSLIRRS